MKNTCFLQRLNAIEQNDQKPHLLAWAGLLGLHQLAYRAYCDECAGNNQQLSLLISVVSLLGKALLKPAPGQESGHAPTPAVASACRIQLLNQFLFEHCLDNINLFRVVRWVNRSKFHRVRRRLQLWLRTDRRSFALHLSVGSATVIPCLSGRA